MKIPNITYKSVLKRYTNIERRNKAFHELDDESKRLEIAWDALNLVMEGKLNPSFGCYWNWKLMNIKERVYNPKDFQDSLITELNEDCYVCQRGAIMVSTIRLGNRIDPDEDDNMISGYNATLLQGFSMKDMDNMEGEYEISCFKHPYRNNSREKLMNILCNILVNGNFNTEDQNDYLI